jgi:hypothetical protein
VGGFISVEHAVKHFEEQPEGAREASPELHEHETLAAH